MTDNQVQAIKQELSRVRQAKRNCEANLGAVYADNESGKLRIRVNSDPDFRREVAQKIVSEAHPGYHSSGHNYADPVDGKVYYKDVNAAWNPWADSINFRIVAVDELADVANNDFSSTVDWNDHVGDIPYRDMVAAYLESEGEAFEDNGDIPEWVRVNDVIAFASDDKRWEALLDRIRDDAHENAVQFALSEIKDEIVVEVNS